MPRLAPALVVAAFSLGGACKGDAPFGKPSDRIVPRPDRGPSPAAVLAASEAFPSLSCVERELGKGSIIEVAGVAPPEFRKEPKPQDEGWIPIRLDDLAVLPDGFAVLDGRGSQITRFSRDFHRRIQWGRPGQGPMELNGASALAVSPSGRELWVLNGRPPRLVAFDLEGRFLRTVPLPRSGTDLAIDADGRFYVAHRVFRHRVRADPAMGTLVSVFAADGSPAGDLVRLTENDWHVPRIVTPAIVHVRLTSLGHRVVVMYEASGVVEVYERGTKVSSFTLCVPERLRKAYEKQMSIADGTGEAWVTLVSDVTFDAEGNALAVGPPKDSADQYHIDVFDGTGTTRGSIVLPARGRSLMSYPRFAGSADSLVGYNPNGVVVLFAIERAGPAFNR